MPHSERPSRPRLVAPSTRVIHLLSFTLSSCRPYDFTPSTTYPPTSLPPIPPSHHPGCVPVMFNRLHLFLSVGSVLPHRRSSFQRTSGAFRVSRPVIPGHAVHFRPTGTPVYSGTSCDSSDATRCRSMGSNPAASLRSVRPSGRSIRIPGSRTASPKSSSNN